MDQNDDTAHVNTHWILAQGYPGDEFTSPSGSKALMDDHQSNTQRDGGVG